MKAGGQKTRAREIEVLSVEQLTACLEAVPEARRVPLLLTGWCGLRSGEVRALRACVISTWTPAWCGYAKVSSGSRISC